MASDNLWNENVRQAGCGGSYSAASLRSVQLVLPVCPNPSLMPRRWRSIDHVELGMLLPGFQEVDVDDMVGAWL